MWSNRVYEVLAVGQRYAAATEGAPARHHVLAAGQVHLQATGVHQGKGQGKGQEKGKGKGHGRGHHHKMNVVPQHFQLAGKRWEFRKEYSPSGEARRAFWQKLKAAYPELKRWSELTRMVNEYLKGSYRKEDGLYYDANDEDHQNAMLLLHNKYLKAKYDPPLNEWPPFYERGMSDLKII
tara:strand:+ start:91 stop:630 length:540 start_codon:yes stop_codon:yes gene_type:complete